MSREFGDVRERWGSNRSTSAIRKTESGWPDGKDTFIFTLFVLNGNPDNSVLGPDRAR